MYLPENAASIFRLDLIEASIGDFPELDIGLDNQEDKILLRQDYELSVIEPESEKSDVSEEPTPEESEKVLQQLDDVWVREGR